MAEEKTADKKMNKGLIAGICIAVVAAIAAVVTVVVINVTKPKLVGNYVMSAILDSEGNESKDSFEFFKALGANYEIEFNEDKTGTLKIKIDSEAMSSLVSSFANALTGATTDENGDVTTENVDTSSVTSQLQDTSIPFTYDDKKINLGTNGLGSSELDYEFKDGAVIVDYYGQKMKFTK